MARFNEYGDYLVQRWKELGGEAATDAVRKRTGIEKEEQMPWGVDQQRAEALAEEFKAVQCPIFVRIVGELHHKQGHKDVGLGRKNGGNNWQTSNGPVASDIIVLKSLDGDGSFQWVDCFSSMGGPAAKPGWAVIEPNTDRTWLEPPPPEPSVVPAEPSAPQVPNPLNNPKIEETAALASQVLTSLVWTVVSSALAIVIPVLRDELREELKSAQPQPGNSFPRRIALKDSQGNYLCADRSRTDTPVIANRISRGDWETLEVEIVE